MSHESDEPLTHPSLLMRVRDVRDSQAWSEFVAVYAPLLFGYFRLKQLQDSDAADVAQEVLSRLARSLQKFEYQPQRGRFRNWLGRIAHRELLRHRERHRHRGTEQSGVEQVVFQAEDQSAWNDHFHAEILQSALHRIEKEFATETWQAFELAWMESRPPAEVAATLRIGVNKVYVSQSRVLKRLRVEVLALSEDFPALQF